MNVTGIIFANIYENQLGDLTGKRAMGALPFGGRYRQIDFALSNMATSGIHQIGIISKHKFQSLMNHVGSGEEWNLEISEGGLEFLTPYAMSSTANHRGKLEALYYGLGHLEHGAQSGYVVLADAGVLYNMDMTKVVEAHIASGKDVTVVTKAGIANGRKELDFAVKMDGKGQILDVVVDYVGNPSYLASMGLFVVSRDLLIHHVRECVAHNLYDFERDFVQRLYQRGELSLNVYPFEGVALFNETVEEYYNNNLALIDKDVRHDIFRGCHSVYTRVRDQVPTFYGEGCKIEDSIVSDGCILEGTCTNSILFRQVTLAPGTTVDSCVLMNRANIGEGATLRYVILDKDVTIRPGTQLIGSKNHPIIIKRGEVV